MIIKFKENTPRDDIESLRKSLIDLGFSIHESIGDTITIFGIVGDTSAFDINRLYAYEFVDSVLRIQEPYKRVNRKFHPADTIIDVGGIEIGGKNVVIIGGPCAVESLNQMDIITPMVVSAGAKILRAGAFKPRTSPYSFQGLGEDGLAILKSMSDKYLLPVVSEVMSLEDLPAFIGRVDMLQIGARNMQNYPLLREVGKTNLPVLLKRGLANTIEEWLMSAEYILSEGNQNVILCERGIRTFEPSTRNTLDISAVPVLKKLTHLPVLIDPSHASGRWEYVESLSKAAIAAGCDGLIIEVHHEPEKALSDGQQSLKPERFRKLIEDCRRVALAVDRTLE